MKKILVTILTLAMMTSTVAAFGDGAPMGGPMGGQLPRMVQGQQPPEKPTDAPEKPSGEQAQAPSGEKPADALKMSSDEEQSSTDDTRQASEKPTDAPEMPSGGQAQASQGQAPSGAMPTDGQKAPKMIDFDAMVTSGVISQETRDAIRAYMDEHKPEVETPTVPDEGEPPAEGEPNLLNDLLSAGVITQTEYDTLNAAA